SWLLDVRKSLHEGKGVDLRSRPDSVEWLKLQGDGSDIERLLQAGNVKAKNNGGVLIIGDSKNPRSQRLFARRIHGAVTVEAVNLTDLVKFAESLDLNTSEALETIAEFADQLVANFGANQFLKRIETLIKGRAVKGANVAEVIALEFLSQPSYALVRNLLIEIQNLPGVKVYRPDIFRCCIQALN